MNAKRKVIVVDGSNVATEGRTAPSLVQLDECVQALLEEYPGAEAIVVVDATFEHRIDASERSRFKDAELAGEVVTPPAGAIGRGDAFILKIADRADAVVLSNDSFQEFHAEHPWLFDDGRLLGGKPVPGVGWIFTPRNPVRGPKSREVRSKAAKLESRQSAEEVATTRAPAARAARATATKAPAAKGVRKSVSRARSVPDDEPVEKRAARPARKAAGTEKTTAKSAKPRAVAKGAAAVTAAPAKRRSRAALAAATPEASTAHGTKKQPAKSASRRAAAASKAPAKAAQVAAVSTGSRSRTKSAADSAPSTARTTKGSANEPANTPRAFLALVSNHPLKSTIDGTVSTFTSHGAMVTIPVGRGMEVVCYAPLAGLGRPAPTRARDVLKKGETRSFRIVAYDTERRIAELSLASS